MVDFLKSSIISHQPAAEKTAQTVTYLQLITATFVLGFLLHGELTALDDLDSFLGLVTGELGDVLDLVNDLVALKDLSEDDVTSIEPTSNLSATDHTNG